MYAALNHLARRGYEAVEEYEYKMPVWGIVVFATTAALFCFASFSIEYTFGRIVPTLVMVESPEAILFEPLDTVDPDAPVTKKPDPELLLVKQQPITSSFRSTIKHLRSKAGFRARFRGLALFIVYTCGLSIIANVFMTIPFVHRRIGFVLASILLANLSLTWTHIVISDPSQKPWYRRVPDARVLRKIVGPTAIFAIAEQLSFALPELLASIYGLDVINHQDAARFSDSERNRVALKGLSVLALSLVLGFFVVLPARVILTRVQGSLLADDQESIVPFDRSFGGKVVPEIVGGSGILGLRDAWSTFDRSARVRLIKTYVKVFAMQVALSLLAIGVFSVEALIVIGKSDLKKIISKPNDRTGAGLIL